MKPLLKYSGILTALMAVVFGAEYAVLACCLPEQLFPLMVAIPLFFIVFGWLALRFAYLKPSVSIGLLMGIKSSKIILSIILILLYVLLVKDHSVSFLVSFSLYFLTYLTFETWMLYSVNKKKSIKKNEQL
jgi:hypothetical protein